MECLEVIHNIGKIVGYKHVNHFIYHVNKARSICHMKGNGLKNTRKLIRKFEMKSQ